MKPFQADNYRHWTESEFTEGLCKEKAQLTFFFKMFNLKFARNPIILKHFSAESIGFQLKYYLNWMSLKRCLPQLKQNQKMMFDALQTDHIKIKNDDVTLDTLFLHNKKTQHNRWVIICHGLNSNKYKSFFYGWYYLCQGYHIVVYDSRNHGNSTKTSITFGYAEKTDLAVIISHLQQNYPVQEINFHGWSMGSMVISSYLREYGDQITTRFVILDSPIDSLAHLWSTVMERWKIDYYAQFDLYNHYCLQKYQYSPLDVVPGAFYKNMTNQNCYFITYINDILTIPVLGRQAFVNKKQIGGHNALLEMPYKHASGIYEAYDEYFTKIQMFINECKVVVSGKNK